MIVSTLDLLNTSDILIYPNPSKGAYHFKIDGTLFGTYRISIINNLGQTIRQGKVDKTGNTLEFQMNLSDIPSGTYIVQISSEKENQTKKIIKE
ncbi:MAG: T9SS type A sorting domain-containing protein [Saprospiraceae bacterium]